jgi:nucleoid DNA-binding protein
MRKTHWLSLAALIGVLAATAYSQLPARTPPPFQKELAAISRIEEADSNKVLEALGPTITRQIAAGREVRIPGLGLFRVVRLAETKNLEDGRVVNQLARNIVEFLPDPIVDQAANAPGAIPAVEVPAFQYLVLPGQTPTMKVPNTRMPSTRIR